MRMLRQLLERWYVLVSALLLAGIVHICTVMALPLLYRADAYTRLARNLPENAFVILPQAQPKAQILPYQTPDARYAVCRFDARFGPVTVKASLPESGWTLSLYTANGEGYYSFPAAERRTVLNLVVMPPGEHFLAHVNEARHQDQDLTQVTAPSSRGIAVVQAPLKGRTFSGEVERELAQAVCRQQKF